MTETANKMAARLMVEIETVKKSTYTKGDVRAILNSISQAGNAIDGTCRAPISLKSLRRGDVFIAKMVGGKVRPWIVLRTDGPNVTALSMSSGDSAPGMVQSKCRLWPSSWIGTTISRFTVEHAAREVVRPYTNLAHLAKIEASIAAGMGMQKVCRKLSMAKILTNIRGKRAGI